MNVKLNCNEYNLNSILNKGTTSVLLIKIIYELLLYIFLVSLVALLQTDFTLCK